MKTWVSTPALALALLACGSESDGNSAAPPAPEAKAALLASGPRGEPSNDKGVADPVAYVRSIYDSYLASRDPVDPSGAYSPGLQALIEKDREEAGGEVGRLDFDPWINGQDWEIASVDLREEPARGGGRTVVARFKNMDAATENRFSFVKAGDKWLIDDIENVGGPADTHWRLRQILSGPL
ncbi:MAG TPA: DUF3828 domain-containing protein [Allosphingosinicella sp.]|jgi:hypothetical protein